MASPGGWDRRGLLAGLAAASAPRPGLARTQEPAPAAPSSLADLVIDDDAERRMRVPVTVNGRGPFPFLVDTGADHSVLSAELAAGLGLKPTGFARVNGIAGAALRATARVERLEVGGRKLSGLTMALLAREDLGALGLIGLDGLGDQRVRIDFDRRRMSVEPSRAIAFDPEAIVVRGKARFGRLMLVDSTLRRTPLYVVLDTGAQDTLGNEALRRFLNARRRKAATGEAAAPIRLLSVTGQTVEGDADELPELTLGGITLKRLPVIYADLHTFGLYHLRDEPALMLGIGALRAFSRVSIDFGRREVRFELPGSASPMPEEAGSLDV